MTIERAAEIAAAEGFSRIAAEGVDYQKDSVVYHKTIKQIISGLFEAESLPPSQRVLLKILSLFGQTGVSVDQVCEMLELENKEDISAIYHQGWIYVDDAHITMHPVVEEVVSSWELSDAALDAATKVLLYLDIKLRVEAEKEEYPKQLLPHLQNTRDHRIARKILPKDNSDRAKAVYLSRIRSFMENPATNRIEVREILRLATAVLECGKCEPKLRSSDIYMELLYYTIVNTPYENEHFIREKSEEFIALFRHHNERMLLRIYQELLEVLYDHGEFEEAKRRIRQARTKISGNLSPDVWGRYYYILAGYYDNLLDGAYDAGTAEEMQLVRLLLDATDKAIRWLNLSGTGDSGIFLGECCRLKALVLIRSGLGKKRQIQAILERIRKLIDKYAHPNSRLARDYNMTLAWYHTYLDKDLQKTRGYMFKAYEITDIISTSELAKIDDQLCPMANILLEWRQYDEAAMYLIRAILSCTNHMEIAAYARRQAGLLGHLLEVYFYAGEYAKCQTVINKLDEKVQKIDSLDIWDYVPEEIRRAVENANAGLQ